MPVTNTYSSYLQARKLGILISLPDSIPKTSNNRYTPFHAIKDIVEKTEPHPGPGDRFNNLVAEQQEDTNAANNYQTIRDPSKQGDVDTFINNLRTMASDFESTDNGPNDVVPTMRRLAWEEDLPLMDPYDRSYQYLVNSAYYLVPVENVARENRLTINTGGKSYRNILLSDIAYIPVGSRPQWVQYKNIGDPTTQYMQYIEDISTINHCVYTVHTDVNDLSVVIAFRGTATYQDTLTDLAVISGIPLDPRFFETDQTYKAVLKRFPPPWKIEATGHSLGGTLALLLNYMYNIKVDVFSPGIGKNLYRFNSNRANATAHIVRGDIVPALVYVNVVVGTLNVYTVQDTNYGYYGYHLRSNFYV